MLNDFNLHTETIEYHRVGTVMQGYFAYDKTVEGTRPGVLVFPEWWGVNDYIKQRTQELAELGYAALAVDMYGGGQVADNADKAAAMMNSVRMPCSITKYSPACASVGTTAKIPAC